MDKWKGGRKGRRKEEERRGARVESETKRPELELLSVVLIPKYKAWRVT